ncbi:MAG: PQQ-binding-like beta-propeller repeat protein [Verrucomicrobiota bacterium]
MKKCLLLAQTAALLSLPVADAHAQDAPPPSDPLTHHQSPPPLSPSAVTEDWPRFLGPHDDATSRETPLSLPDSSTPPPIIWELKKGAGYAGPSIADDKLYLFHRLEDQEVLECRDPESGKLLWSQKHAVEYRDRYGFSPGPRAAPVVDENRVYTLGVTGRLACHDTASGNLLWEREINTDYHVPQYFFGTGPSPLVYQDKLILNVGGRQPPDNGVCVVALNKLTGETLWETRDTWGASYASPIIASLHNAPRLLVFAGGESDPATGGLLCLDPDSGETLDRFPWRADKFESVNASTPVLLPNNRVYISECYQKGGVLLEYDKSFKSSVVWKAPDFGMHWMTPILIDGTLYGFRGRNEPDALLAAYDAATGTEYWREDLSWRKVIDGRNFGWGFFRGSLLQTPQFVIALGEFGTLAVFELSPEGLNTPFQTDLFFAREAWTLPVLHKGLLYVCQNTPDVISKAPPRLLCYSLRPAND